MTKAALREKRLQERIARRNRNRIITIVVVVVAILGLTYLILNEQLNKPSTSEEIASGFTLSEAAVTTDSGLVYEDIVVGEGAEVKFGDTVSVLYSGYLTDGTLFDSNLETGTPFDVQLGVDPVIPGWEEGLIGMKVGGTRLLVIPSSLAYGPTGAGGTIPPNATLTFEINLQEIK